MTTEILEKAKRKPKTKSTAKRKQYTLDDLAEAAGDRLLDTPEIEALLGSDAATISAGDHPEERHPDLARLSDDSAGFLRTGISLRRLIGVIKELAIPVKLSELAVALIECSLGDYVAIDPQAQLHPGQCQKQFNVAKSTVQAALSGHTFTAAEFADWVASEDIPHHLSVAALGSILRHRRMTAAAEEERRREAEREPDLLDLTTAAIEADKQAERAEQERISQERLSTYRQILARRHKPSASVPSGSTPRGTGFMPSQEDAGQLAYVARELGFDTERLRADVKILDRHDLLVKLASEVDKADREEKRLAGELQKVEETAKQLKQRQREHGSAKNHWRTCMRAGNEAERLREQHPELFPPGAE